MSDVRPVVSDHAVVTFLERVYGLDVDRIRESIGAAIAQGREAAEVAGYERFSVVIGKVRFAIEQGEVVTTTLRLRHRPARHPARRPGRKIR